MPRKDDQNELRKMFNFEKRYPIDTWEIYRQIFLIHVKIRLLWNISESSF